MFVHRSFIKMAKTAVTTHCSGRIPALASSPYTNDLTMKLLFQINQSGS